MCSKLTVAFVILALDNLISAGTIGVNHPHRKSDGRIINGHPVVSHSVPYMVAVTALLKDRRHTERCGGILLSDKHIITAAHCLNDGRTIYRLQFAAHNRYVAERFQIIRTKATFVIHEDNDPSTLTHDIAMIKLEDPVDLNSPNIKSVALPDPKDANKTYVNEAVETFGWGWIDETVFPSPAAYPTELMGINLTVMPLRDCKYEYNTATRFGDVYDYEICTGSHDVTRPVGTCHGDSGGPLIYNNTLIGVTSRGPTWYCSRNEPSVFVSVGKHLDWIKDKMKNM